MQRTRAMQVKAIVLTPPLATMQNVAGQLDPSSRKTYTIDAKHFAQWLVGQDLSLNSLNRDSLVAYRAYLAETYAQSTAARMCYRTHHQIQPSPLPVEPVSTPFTCDSALTDHAPAWPGALPATPASSIWSWQSLALGARALPGLCAGVDIPVVSSGADGLRHIRSSFVRERKTA